MSARATFDGAGFCYAPRWVDARAPVSVNGYSLKRYDISCDRDRTRAVMPAVALRATLTKCLPASRDALDHHLGFVILHYALDGDYLLVSRWYGGNMLKHDLFRLQKSGGRWHGSSLRRTGIVACVWELAVIAFEREAWVSEAMDHGGSAAGLRRYVSRRLQGWV